MICFINLFDIKKDNMIKRYFKYFLTFIVIWLWIISFSNAWYSRQIWISGFSPYDNTIDFSVLKKWSFLSSQLWTTKDLFYFKENYYFGWIYNDSLWWVSLYNRTNWNQGFLKHYWICNEITWTSLNWSNSNCIINDYTQSSLEIISNFLSYIGPNDYFWFDMYDSWNGYKSTLCISSAEFWKSLCFENCYVSNSNYYSCSLYWSYTLWTAGDTTWSLNLNWQFSSIDRFLFSSSPAVKWTDTPNESVEWEVWNLYWDTIYQSCTNWQALQLMRNKYWYNDLICYWWLNSFDLYSGDDYTVVPGSGLTVFDMYNYSSGFYNNFYDWFNSYEFNYAFPCWQGWLCVSNPAIFTTYFDILINSNSPVSAKDVLSYCDLLLKQDLNWNLLDNYNIDSSIKQEVCKKQDNNTISQSWNIVGEDLSWIWNIENVNNSWQVVSWKNIVDWTNFINSYINLLKQNYSIDKNNNVWWVLPGYIVWFLLVILLFRFLRK